MTKNFIKEFIKKEYGITPIGDIKLIQETEYNSTFYVKAGYPYFLRVGKIISPQSVVEEVSLISELKNNNFPVPAIIKNLKGEKVSLPSFSKTLVVFEFIEGKTITNPSVVQAKEAAKILGSLHKITKDQVWDRRERSAMTEFQKCLDKREIIISWLQHGEDFLDEISQTIAKVPDIASGKSLVHGDYRSKNMLFSEENKIKAVVDFEWCFYGPSLYDLGLMLVEWSCLDGQKDFNKKILEVILGGYSDAMGIKYEIDERIKFWMYYSALCDSATYFLRKAEVAKMAGKGKVAMKSYMYDKAQKSLNL